MWWNKKQTLFHDRSNVLLYPVYKNIYLVSNFMIINVNRSFGDLNSIDPTLLSYMSKGFSLINGCTRVLWGFLFDKFSFKFLYTIVCVMEIISNFSIYYVVSNQELYFTLNMIVALAFAGNTSLLPPLVSKKFGLK